MRDWKERILGFKIGWVALVCCMVLVLLAPSASAFSCLARAEEGAKEEPAVLFAEEPAAAETEELGFKEKIAIFLCKLVSDAILFDLDNTDPARVAAAYYFAGYKGQVLFFGKGLRQVEFFLGKGFRQGRLVEQQGLRRRICKQRRGS